MSLPHPTPASLSSVSLMLGEPSSPFLSMRSLGFTATMHEEEFAPAEEEEGGIPKSSIRSERSGERGGGRGGGRGTGTEGSSIEGEGGGGGLFGCNLCRAGEGSGVEGGLA